MKTPLISRLPKKGDTNWADNLLFVLKALIYMWVFLFVVVILLTIALFVHH